MCGTIRVGEGAIQQGAQAVTSGVDDYCALQLATLSGVLPVSGSSDHDGRLTSTIRGALQSYASLMSADAASVRALGTSFVQTDAALAASMR